MMALILGLETS